MVWELRTARHETHRRERKVPFRAALIELTRNVQQVESWNPSLEPDPPKNWLRVPLGFVAIRELLARVWMPGPLWDRIVSVTTNLNAYVEVITAQIQGLPPDAATRGEYTPQRENIRRLYYLVNLYLKQLAGYMISEMRRQRLGVPKDWDQRRPLLAPLGWRYDVDVNAKSVAETVYLIEHGPCIPAIHAASSGTGRPSIRQLLAGPAD